MIMLAIVKKGISYLLLFWVIGVLITGVLYPAFQKKPPENSHPTAAADPNAPTERVRCIDDNDEALIRRLQVIESAKEKLVLSTYYLGRDESGTDIMSALLHAADRGVNIRILVDGFCNLTSLSSSDSFKALVQSPNVEAKIYNPVHILWPWRANYRMHDKYLAADDQVYILGGRNTRNVSLGSYQEKKDIDRDMLVYSEKPGDSLHQVLAYFEGIWNQPIAKLVKEGRRPKQEARAALEQHYIELQTRYPEAFEETDFEALTLPVKSVTLLTNPQEPHNKVPTLWASLVDYMQQGRDLLIQTPYIICNRQMYEDLTSLTQQGRRLRFITNTSEYGANPCGCADYLNNKKKLLNTGAELWEYAGGNSCHTKTVLIDDHISIVGSFNFDMRSAYLDTEMMLVIDSPELNRSLRALDDEYMSKSRGTMPDGSTLTGENYIVPPNSFGRKLFYGLLRAVILPVRHLL